MKNLFLIFILTAACAGEFNPDLSETSDSGGPGGGPGGGSGTAGSDSDDTGDTDPTGGLDMNEGSGTDAGDGDGDGDGDGVGDGDTDTEETGEEADCGDGVLNGNEECDALDFGDETCESQGFVNGGDLWCSENCEIETYTCSPNICDTQPESGNYSACEFDAVEGGETCGDTSLYCLTNAPPDGVCSKTCQTNMECQDASVAGCGEQLCIYPPGEILGRCFITCNNNNDCPDPMSCQVFTFADNSAVCM